MIRIFFDILNFFRKEKFYAFLFVLNIGVILYSSLAPKDNLYPNVRGREGSEILAQYQRSEAKLQDKIKSAGSIERYLSKRPRIGFLFWIFSILLPALFTAGLILDFLFLSRPRWRRRIHHTFPETTDWKISMIFKVVLLLTAAAFVLSLLLGLLNRFLLPLSSNFFILFHTTVIDFLCLAFMVWAVRGAGGHWKDLGLRIPEGKFFREVLIGWAGYLALLPVFFIVLIGLLILAHWIGYEPPAHPLVYIFLEEEKRSPLLIGCSLFLAAVVGPIFEEFFFRGFCYPILKRKTGVLGAMLITSALFALIHENSFAFWPIFILGMGLVYLYEKRSSLIGPIVLHMTHNAVFIFYFFFAKRIVMQEGSG